MIPDISVIICTHNPREAYFVRVLDTLRAQTLAMDKWELLVVDNASTTALADRIDLSWHPVARTVREENIGFTSARLCGIREARGSLLVFVDDDNLLDVNFLEVAARVAIDKPFLGAWSGQSRPEFEAPPPEWTRRYWGSLVIREFETDVWSNLPRLAETMPCGAGLCVRREAAQHYLYLHESGKRPMLLDRIGSSLVSGGDNDLAACACDVGLGVGLIAVLKLTHIIPSVRLTQDYLCRLAEGVQFSSLILDAERGLAPPERGTIGMIADFIRVRRARGPHREMLKAVYRGRASAMQHVKARQMSRSREKHPSS